jgi:hypothetical protein
LLKYYKLNVPTIITARELGEVANSKLNPNEGFEDMHISIALNLEQRLIITIKLDGKINCSMGFII